MSDAFLDDPYLAAELFTDDGTTTEPEAGEPSTEWPSESERPAEPWPSVDSELEQGASSSGPLSTLIDQLTAARPMDIALEPEGARSDADIAEDVRHWFRKGTSYTCGPSAAAMVIADWLDVELPSEAELAEWAGTHSRVDETGKEVPLLSDEGMMLPSLELMLDEHGVPSTLGVGTIDLLDELLDEDYAAIAFVDLSDDVDGDEVADDVPHAVRVVDVDQARGVVVLSDSGLAQGRGIEIPIDVFDAAWEDRQHSMLVTDQPESDGPLRADGPMIAMEPEASTDGHDDVATTFTVPEVDPAFPVNVRTGVTDPLAGMRPAGIIVLPLAFSAAAVAVIRAVARRSR